MRWFVHVDMDAYFASVEQLLNPALRGKPVIVGGRPGSRGVVSTASYEARPFGVRSGMPIAEAVRRCPHAVFLPGRFALYVDTSKRIFEVLRRFSPRVEPASIDEAYVELETDAPRDVVLRMQMAIRDEVQLTASFGVSDTKYLAKIASGFEKPHGLTVMTRADVPERLWSLPVGALHGVGSKTAARLYAHGYTTIGDLARAPDGWLERQLGAFGAALRRHANGEGGGRVVPPEEAPDAKSLGCEQTLERDLFDRSRLEALLSALAEKVGRRARRHGLAGRCIVLKLRDRGFHTITHGRIGPHPVDADGEIARVAHDLFAETRFWERGVRLVGVSLEQLVRNGDGRQLAFEFETARALPALDQIRTKYGEQAIGAARTLEAGADALRKPRISFSISDELAAL